MFVGSFRPAGVLTEKELCRGEAALAHLYYGYLRWSRTVFRGEASDSSATSALDGLGVSVSVLPSNFPLGEPVKRMGRTINEGALPEGQVVPSIGAAGHSMLEEAPLEATTNPGPDGVW